MLVSVFAPSRRLRGCGPVLCLLAALAFPALARAQADLVVDLTAPDSAIPGTDIAEAVRLVVANRGNRTAPGTESRGRDGYMVDLFLTRGTIPEGFAIYADSYADGVLLRGGRVSNTSDLAPRRRVGYRIGAGIPGDTPDGDYRLCAKVDPGGKVRERSKDNNVACVPLRVARLQIVPIQPLQPVQPLLKDLSPFFGKRLAQPRVLGLDRLRELPRAIEPPRPTGGGEASRSVLADGTIVLSYPDGRIVRLRPDGTIETVMPDGTVIVPYAMQVQGAELPPLPGDLASWGGLLGDQLLGILRNVLSETEFAAYEQTEAGKDYYEQIDWRLRCIAFLTSAE